MNVIFNHSRHLYLVFLLGSCNAFNWESIYLPSLNRSELVHALKGLNVFDLVGDLSNVYASTSRVFTYHDSGVSKIWFPKFSNSYNFLNISAVEFLIPSGTYYYYSGSLLASNFDHLRGIVDIQNLVEMRKVSPTFWAASAGVRATAHYDTVYNVYIHLQGRKIIKLLPPRSIRNMYMFGRYHPHPCQSRILPSNDIPDFLNFTVLSYPTAFADGGSNIHPNVIPRHFEGMLWEFDLNAGDILFIPPFWVHETHSITTSASISLWWDARELDIMDGVYAMPLPFEEKWSPQRTLAGARHFSSLLLQEVDRQIETESSGPGFARFCAPHISPSSLFNASVARECHIATAAVRLLRIRYLEDVAMRCLETQASKSIKTPMKDIDNSVGLRSSQGDFASNSEKYFTESDLRRFRERAKIFASAFMKILDEPLRHSSDSEDSSNAGIEDGGEHAGSCHSTAAIITDEGERRPHMHAQSCSTFAGSQSLVEDRLTIMTIKLSDYIEDLFQFTSPEGVHPAAALLEWLGGLNSCTSSCDEWCLLEQAP